MEDTTTLLRFKKAYGEKLIGLWLYESLVGIDTDEWKVTQNKIAKVKSVLQDVCYMLAERDKWVDEHEFNGTNYVAAPVTRRIVERVMGKYFKVVSTYYGDGLHVVLRAYEY